MEITDQSFNIVDIKPANMEELQEVSQTFLVFIVQLKSYKLRMINE